MVASYGRRLRSLACRFFGLQMICKPTPSGMGLQPDSQTIFEKRIECSSQKDVQIVAQLLGNGTTEAAWMDQDYRNLEGRASITPIMSGSSSSMAFWISSDN
jgi:hypothetical protein